jgi:ATP dependent DNA ligase-like protein
MVGRSSSSTCVNVDFCRALVIHSALRTSKFGHGALSQWHAPTPIRALHPDPRRQGSSRAGLDSQIKHDGYRLIVQKDHKRVRLFTRNGHDWTDRYPLIVEAALRNRATSFVIDGEAVLLGVDGVSDFDGLHARQHDAEVQLYAFDCRSCWSWSRRHERGFQKMRTQ